MFLNAAQKWLARYKKLFDKVSAKAEKENAAQSVSAAVARRDGGRSATARNKKVDNDRKKKYNYSRKAKYISYKEISIDTHSFLKYELVKIYAEADNSVADEIAISRGEKVYIIDSGK